MKKQKKIAFITLSSSIITAVIATIILLSNPKISRDHLEAYLEAKKAYTIGDLDETITITTKLSKKSPLLYQGQLLLGKSLFFTDRYEEADLVLSRLVKKHPAYLEAGLWKARTEIQLNQIDNAYNRIEYLLSYNSDDPRLLGLMANIEEQKGELGRAIDFFKRASLYEEELAKNRLSLGKIYSRMGVYDKALDELTEAKELLDETSPLYTPLNAITEDIKNRMNK